jgi:hypothetical protein
MKAGADKEPSKSNASWIEAVKLSSTRTVHRLARRQEPYGSIFQQALIVEDGLD